MVSEKIVGMARMFLAAAVVSFFAGNVFAEEFDRITALEAKNYIDDTAIVCGEVVTINHSEKSKGKPTFINLDKPFPNHIFTIVFFENIRQTFPYDPESLLHENICVVGHIELYKGKPQIKLVDEYQIIRPNLEGGQEQFYWKQQ